MNKMGQKKRKERQNTFADIKLVPQKAWHTTVQAERLMLWRMTHSRSQFIQLLFQPHYN